MAKPTPAKPAKKPRQITRRQKADAIRALSMDAVQKANSGHPGAPMGLADAAEVLWSDHLKHNPKNPNWCDRDRFVLSNGHASMLLYALLHLTGYHLNLTDLKNFRQLHSKTPGHPEYGCAPGVETTTGPLGQGFANAVGMAIAEKTLAAQFNRPAHTIVDHHTYAIVGDGCLMEGISHEAASLAGTLALGKLIVLYDDNGISIDGEIRDWFTDNTPARFTAYNWHVIPDIDGHDPAAVHRALQAAKKQTTKPTLICCRTTIGFGSPNKAGKASSHGSALGEDEVAHTRQQLNWHHPPFHIPKEIHAAWDATQTGKTAEQNWQTRFKAYQKAHPQLAEEFLRRTNPNDQKTIAPNLPKTWRTQTDQIIAAVNTAAPDLATRKASQNALQQFTPHLPELIGGSADLAESNLTLSPHTRPITQHPDGNYIYFGVREFAMTAIVNGIALHRGFKPYGATFLVFSDYARNALRLAALMNLPAISIFTHDSIGLGEDGPTHQPIEQLASLRLIPRMAVWRPCDAVETTIAWREALQSTAQPFALILSRQTLPHQPRDKTQIAQIAKGGYTLREFGTTKTTPPAAIIIATGSEIPLALTAAEQIHTETATPIRVVSMPSTDRFAEQDRAYRDTVLPPQIRARVSVEAGTTATWREHLGTHGIAIGINTFGESAPGAEVFRAFNFTPEHIATAVKTVLATLTPAE